MAMLKFHWFREPFSKTEDASTLGSMWDVQKHVFPFWLGVFARMWTQQSTADLEQKQLSWDRLIEVVLAWFDSQTLEHLLFCSENTSEPASGTKTAGMCCLATEAKIWLVNVDSMVSYFYVLLPLHDTVRQSVQPPSFIFALTVL